MSQRDPFERAETVLDVQNLVKHFPLTKGLFMPRKAGAVRAVDDVSFSLRRGETLGIVGSQAAASRRWPSS